MVVAEAEFLNLSKSPNKNRTVWEEAAENGINMQCRSNRNKES